MRAAPEDGTAMTRSRWDASTDDDLAAIAAEGRTRSLRSFDALGPEGVVDGRRVISFAGNDYLGLSAHPAVREAAKEAVDRWGTGATASRLVVGTRPCHEQLEAAYAEWRSAEAAVVVSSGFAANLAVLTTFGASDVTVLSDELNHASIIDGCRLSRAEVAVWRHRDLDHLDALLAEVRGRALVVTDSVFSMDGDVAPLDEIADRCIRHDALLVVDEAHGVLGPRCPDIDGLRLLRVGTLSKALGSMGGVIAGPRSMIDLIVNRARSFIFSTGLTPADTAAARAAISVIRSAEGDALMQILHRHIDRVAPGHPSPVIPVVLGAEQAALDAAAALLEQGLLVPAIRPPTVAPGSSRLRIALSAAHTDLMVDKLMGALERLGPTAAAHRR